MAADTADVAAAARVAAVAHSTDSGCPAVVRSSVVADRTCSGTAAVDRSVAVPSADVVAVSAETSHDLAQHKLGQAPGAAHMMTQRKQSTGSGATDSVDVAVDECGQSSTHSVGRPAAAARIVDADPQ